VLGEAFIVARFQLKSHQHSQRRGAGRGISREDIFDIFLPEVPEKNIPMLSFISRQTTESAMKHKSFSKFHYVE
jgi:hypothetical protein